LDVSRLTQLGWRARTSLKEGLRRFYQAFLEAEGGDAVRHSHVGA
jgi:GDP-L-fucose synthase